MSEVAGPTSGTAITAVLAALAVTSLPDPGAGLVGVNNQTGRYSEPSVQGVLDEDVITRSDLAANDGTGGASLVGVQNLGGYFGGSQVLETILQSVGSSIANFGSTASGKGASLIGLHNAGGYYGAASNVETAIQGAGAKDATQDTSIATNTTNIATNTTNIATNTTNIAANTTAIALRQFIANPSVTTLSSGNIVETDLSDAVTNIVTNIVKWKHLTSGTAAAGFGTSHINTLPSAAGTARDAATLSYLWSTATDGAEDAQFKVSAMRGGTSLDLVRFNGKNASGNAPLEVLATNADTAAVIFSASATQEIQKSGSGDIGIRARSGGNAYIASFNYAALGCVVESSSLVDTFAGRNVSLGDATTNGLFWIPSFETTAWKPAALTPAGFLAHHVGIAFNVVDGKLFFTGNGHVWSLTATVVI